VTKKARPPVRLQAKRKPPPPILESDARKVPPPPNARVPLFALSLELGSPTSGQQPAFSSERQRQFQEDYTELVLGGSWRGHRSGSRSSIEPLCRRRMRSAIEFILGGQYADRISLQRIPQSTPRRYSPRGAQRYTPNRSRSCGTWALPHRLPGFGSAPPSSNGGDTVNFVVVRPVVALTVQRAR